jgi:hypothetical protein
MPSPAAKALANWPDASQAKTRVGDFLVLISHVEITQTAIVDFLGETRYAREVDLSITLSVKNTHDNQLRGYDGYMTDSPDLLDNFGNTYAKVNFDRVGRIAGQTRQTLDVYPGKWHSDVFVFTQPVDKVTHLKLRFSAQPLGGKGYLQFLIPRAMIKGLPPP